MKFYLIFLLVFSFFSDYLNRKMVNSSLAYEILLYLNSFYFGMFAICEIWLTIFKTFNFPYPVGSFVSEIILLILLCCTEAIRIFLGRKGNLTERSFPVLISIVLTVPSVLGVVYFLIWQTYVLRLEMILCIIQLSLHGLELIFAFLSLCTNIKNHGF